MFRTLSNLLLPLLFPFVLAAQQKNSLIIKKIVLPNEEGGQPVEKAEFYNKEKKLLTFTLNETWGDCNSESAELGHYEETDSSLILYTLWTREGDAPVSPQGARKTVYRKQAGGMLKKQTAVIYLETTRLGYLPENKGMEFLFEPPKTAEEQALLRQYTNQVARDYQARFIYGKAAERLVAEVKLKIEKAESSQDQIVK